MLFEQNEKINKDINPNLNESENILNIATNLKMGINECSNFAKDNICIRNGNDMIKIADAMDVKLKESEKQLSSLDKSKILDKRMKETGKCSSMSECIKVAEVQLNPEFRNKLKSYFKKEGPYDSNKWLSNFDIMDHLKQLETAFNKISDKKFYAIEFQMSDFKKSESSELRDLKYMHLYKENYRYFGCVVNTDKSTGSGKHWIAIFIDLVNGSVEYFNSSGTPISTDADLIAITKSAHLIAVRLTHELLKYKITVNYVDVSAQQHQYDSHSCGVYSLFYIFMRLNGEPYQSFSKEINNMDKKMHLYRQSGLFMQKKGNVTGSALK
jgi:hypothetical protein